LLKGDLKEKDNDMSFLLEIDFYPVAFVNGFIHKQQAIHRSQYFEHYLIPLDGAITDTKIILNEVKIKDH